MEEMTIWKYIISIRGTIYKKTQEPFIRLITVYLKDGIVHDVGITAKPERMKKARCVGICDERKIVHVEPHTKILDEEGFDFQHGNLMIIYDCAKKEIRVFKTD